MIPDKSSSVGKNTVNRWGYPRLRTMRTAYLASGKTLIKGRGEITVRAIGIVLAGGNNHRMKELSQKRAICAMPVAGSYRSIDFTLSNMSNSHIQKVAVFTQYNSRSLNEHLSSSKWWDFGRKAGRPVRLYAGSDRE